jgi:hypothetical protein
MTEPSSEERRSPRVLLRVALKVGAPGAEARDAETAVVNRHGGLLLARQPFAEQESLEITNLESGRKAPFRVVWSGGPGPRSLFKLGVELIAKIDDFWGPDYDRLAEGATAPSS